VTRNARRLAGLSLAVLALGAAGCGGDDNEATDAYVDDVNRIQSQLVTTYQRVASEITTGSTAGEDAATVERLQAAVDRTAAQLSKVEAPSEVERLHEQLTSALGAYGDDLETAAGGLASGEREQITEARAELTEQTDALREQFATTITDINNRLRD
jgi:hypothetical protein